MRCDASIVNATNNVTTLTYVSERYYFFRCDVFGSRRLIWKTSDRQPFIVAPFTATGRIVSDDEVINYLVERVEVGDKETNTNFTSYLWFYSENYKPEFVQCESFEFSTTAFFGNLQHLHFFIQPLFSLLAQTHGTCNTAIQGEGRPNQTCTRLCSLSQCA